MRRPRRGFSLVEILVAITIILIVAAIAIPVYMSSVQRGYEASAVEYLRALVSAQETYRMANHEYADTFAKLEPYLVSELRLHQRRAPGGMAFAMPPAWLADDQGQGNGQGQGDGQGQGNGNGQGQGNGHGNGQGQGGTQPSQGNTASPPDSIVHAKYIMTLTRLQTDQWQCTSAPIQDPANSKFFYVDHTGVIRYALGVLVDETGTPL